MELLQKPLIEYSLHFCCALMLMVINYLAFPQSEILVSILTDFKLGINILSANILQRGNYLYCLHPLSTKLLHVINTGLTITMISYINALLLTYQQKILYKYVQYWQHWNKKNLCTVDIAMGFWQWANGNDWNGEQTGY